MHIFINHHFFYGDQELGKALRGPNPEAVHTQLNNLTAIIPAADNLSTALQSDELTFSITIDDGSRSILDVVPIFKAFNVHVCLCVCGVSTLGHDVLQAHKINLLRTKFPDNVLFTKLKTYYPTFNFDNAPLRGKFNSADLYRYDQPITRQLKIGLNYQLPYKQTKDFVDDLFTQVFPNVQNLYLSIDDLTTLKSEQVEIVFHGQAHRLWSELAPLEHQLELTPPDELLPLLGETYLLSIPFGMPGSYNRRDILRDKGQATGAFTMGRQPIHEVSNSFQWLHRYDQADIFDQNQQVKPLDIFQPYL